jgi:hypothetical protein
MGVARVRRRSEFEGREGEMEWVWSLYCISNIFRDRRQEVTKEHRRARHI